MWVVYLVLGVWSGGGGLGGCGWGVWSGGMCGLGGVVLATPPKIFLNFFLIFF